MAHNNTSSQSKIETQWLKPELLEEAQRLAYQKGVTLPPELKKLPRKKLRQLLLARDTINGGGEYHTTRGESGLYYTEWKPNMIVTINRLR